jgi:peptidoglycan/LPS O-acetylase OafA/YrhL
MAKISNVISTRENNFVPVRIFLSATVIYFHAFYLGQTDRKLDVYYLLPFSHFDSLGGLAVDGFFFLSGLFVTQSYYNDPSVINFAIKRVLRLFPALFVCLVVTAFLAAFASHGMVGWRFALFAETYRYIVHNSVFDQIWGIRGIFERLKYPDAINGSLHTLPLEFKLYCMLAAVALFGALSSRWLTVLAGAALCSTAALFPTLITAPLEAVVYGQFPIAMFGAGVATYGVARHVSIAWWQGLVLLPAVAFTSGQPQTTLFFVSFVWLVLAIGKTTWNGRGLLKKHDLSYGMYIYGFPITQCLVALWPGIDQYALSAAAIAICGGLAYISWHFVERPAIDFGRTLIAMRRDGLRVLKPTEKWQARTVGILLVGFAGCFALLIATERWPRGPRIPMNAQITNFGPQSVAVGEKFNLQPSGASAMWFAMSEPPPAKSVLAFGRQLVEPAPNPAGATAIVPDSILARPGIVPIRVEDRHFDRVEVSNEVPFEVRSR